MNKNEIRFYLQQYNLAAHKMYGQHFLCDSHYIDAIVAAIQPASHDHILEIGPGLGVLTERLYPIVQSITVVEIDAGFVRVLQDRFSTCTNVNIIHGDFLQLSPHSGYTKIIGNLPYNVASQIIYKVAHEYTAPQSFFLVQKEMAQRLSAHPGTKMYSSLTVGVTLAFTVQVLFDVPPRAFYPMPKVYSTFVQFDRKPFVLTKEEKDFFDKLVASAFWARRKMLKTALRRSPYISCHDECIGSLLSTLHLDHTIRGEQLSLIDFIALAKLCAKIHTHNH